MRANGANNTLPGVSWARRGGVSDRGRVAQHVMNLDAGARMDGRCPQGWSLLVPAPPPGLWSSMPRRCTPPRAWPDSAEPTASVATTAGRAPDNGHLPSVCSSPRSATGTNRASMAPHAPLGGATRRAVLRRLDRRTNSCTAPALGPGCLRRRRYDTVLGVPHRLGRALMESPTALVVHGFVGMYRATPPRGPQRERGASANLEFHRRAGHPAGAGKARIYTGLRLLFRSRRCTDEGSRRSRRRQPARNTEEVRAMA